MKTGNQSLAKLMHDRECPFSFKCLSTDCFECAKMHMEEKKEEERNNEKED